MPAARKTDARTYTQKHTERKIERERCSGISYSNVIDI